MKKIRSAVAGIFLLFLSFNANAQTQAPADYYTGKWDVLIENLPQGDPRMVVSLKRQDGKLGGAILDSAQNEIAKITNVEEKDKSVMVYFTAQGYDVNLEMSKQDDDHITASLMGMFEAKGVRIKEQ